MYRYYCTLRPAAPGTIPKENLVSIQNFDTRQQFHFCKAWAIVTYSEPLDKRTLDAYDLSENKPEPDEYITLESVDYLVFFHGTEAEQETEERKKERNKKKLHRLYDFVLNGDIDYIYTVGKEENGYKHFYILHKSAKYENGLQYTAGMIKDGEFLYMTYDSHITDFNKFLDEFHHGDVGKVYYSELETA